MACFWLPQALLFLLHPDLFMPSEQQHEKPNLTRLAQHDGRRWRQQNLHLPTIAQRRALMACGMPVSLLSFRALVL